MCRTILEPFWKLLQAKYYAFSHPSVEFKQQFFMSHFWFLISDILFFSGTGSNIQMKIEWIIKPMNYQALSFNI